MSSLSVHAANKENVFVSETCVATSSVETNCVLLGNTHNK